jgi:hypothetical protein
MDGEPVIPPPLDDDDDDVAWALQTAAVQWQRGARADAVVWLRRAVDAAIAAGNAARTKDLTRLAAEVADRLVVEAMAQPDSGAPPPRSQAPGSASDVDDLLTAEERERTSWSGPRPPAQSLTGEIPFDFDDSEEMDEADDDDAPTLPPPSRPLFEAPEPEVVTSAPPFDAPSEGEASSPFEDPTSRWDEAPPHPSASVIPDFDPDVLSVPPSDGPPDVDADVFSVPPSDPPVAERGAVSAPPSPLAADELDYDEAASIPPPPGQPPPTSLEEATEYGEDELVSDVESEPPPRAPEPETKGEGAEALAPEPEEDTAPLEPPPLAELLHAAPPRSATASVGVDDDTGAPPDDAPGRVSEPEVAPSASVPGVAVVDNVLLSSVRGFEDLPEESQRRLAAASVVTTLSADEEVSAFAAALVTRGRVGIMPAIADVPAGIAAPGDVVFTRGTLAEGVVLRVVALEDGTTVATWSDETLRAEMADCPWVEDELRLVADRFQALAGATLGPLGERLDDALRGMVTARLEVKAYEPGEVIVEQGKAVPGLHVIGAGRIELLQKNAVVEELGAGDFLFAAEVLSAGAAHASARAGKTGALVLFAPRSAAHELLVSVPPLLEILAG